MKYHLGASSDREFDGNSVHLSLTANPSTWRPSTRWCSARCAPSRRSSERRRAATKVLPILLHGDAAFAGQGVVAECFALSGLKGYRTGGTIHFIVNNQIGFTTAPMYSRSSPYPTDVALMVEAPIFHVNGDDPEAVVHAAKVATEFRQQFDKDVVIDMFCYRRFGHNEGDEPTFTQPLDVRGDQGPPDRRCELYTERLVAEGVIPEGEIEDMKAEFEALPRRRVRGRQGLHAEQGRLARRPAGRACSRPTTSDRAARPASPCRSCRTSADSSPRSPSASTPHKTVQPDDRQPRAQTIETGEGIDWATAERLAFGTLLDEGYPVRLSGQDSRARHLQPAPLRHSSTRRPRSATSRSTTSRPGQARFEVRRLEPCPKRRCSASSTASRWPSRTR